MENNEMKQEPVSKDEEALAKGGKLWAKGGPQGICYRNFRLLKLKLSSFFQKNDLLVAAILATHFAILWGQQQGKADQQVSIKLTNVYMF